MGIWAELQIGRKNTQAFIQADPVTISLNRPTYVTTEAGGRIAGSPDILAPQTVRIVPFSGQVFDRTKPTPDEGLMSDVTQQLVGPHDMDIQQGDYFTYSNGYQIGEYKVTHVSPERGFRTSASLEYRKIGDETG